VIPDEGISGPYYTPLIVAGILYAVLGIAAGIVRGRDHERADQLEDLRFGLVLLTGAYVVVMVIAALLDKSDLVKDMIEVLAIVIVFFGLLLVVMLVVFERGVGGLARLRRPR
jgi:hypothetical protein